MLQNVGLAIRHFAELESHPRTQGVRSKRLTATSGALALGRQLRPESPVTGGKNDHGQLA